VISGVLVLDKPTGPTSHDAVARVRRALGERRAGHAGTLDPMATGVLPVCVGKATRLVRFLADADKEYEAVVRLGFATDTDDAAGAPLGPERPVDVDRDRVEAACAALVGELMQLPPAYSAKRHQGRRAYELARAGEPVPRQAVRVRVHRLDLLDVDAERLSIRVACSKGTYVRSLARDLGEALGCGGHLVALRRTRVGHLGLAEAADWERPDEWRARLIPLADALPGLPAARLGPAGLAAVRHGRALSRELVESGFPDGPGGPVKLVSASGELVAVAERRGFSVEAGALPVRQVLHPRVVLLEEGP